MYARDVWKGRVMKLRCLPSIHITIERWKYNPDIDGYVSTEGRVRDKDGKILQVTAQNGYIRCGDEWVHRLVMTTFRPLGNYRNMTVDHINHNTRDNRLKNLRWMTQEENSTDGAPMVIPKVEYNENAIVWLNGKQMTLKQADKIIRKSSNFKNECSNKDVDQGKRAEKYRGALTIMCKDTPQKVKLYGFVLGNRKK